MNAGVSFILSLGRLELNSCSGRALVTSLSRIGFLFGYDIGVISVSALVGESKKSFV